MNSGNKKKFDFNILSCVFIYLWAAAFFVSSLAIEDSQSRLFPQIMCGLAVFLATLFLVSILTGRHKEPEGEVISFAGTGRAAGMCGLLILYIIANYLFGFYIATILYMPAGMLYLGQRNWKPIVFVTLGLVLIVWLFFDVILNMQMPSGLLIG